MRRAAKERPTSCCIIVCATDACMTLLLWTPQMGKDGGFLPRALRSRGAPAEGPSGADPLRRLHRPLRQGVPAVEGHRETVLLRPEGVVLRDDGADRGHDEVQQHLQRPYHAGW